MTTGIITKHPIQDVQITHYTSRYGAESAKLAANKRAAKIINHLTTATLPVPEGFTLAAVNVGSEAHGVDFTWEAPQITTADGDGHLRVTLTIDYFSKHQMFRATLHYSTTDGRFVRTLVFDDGGLGHRERLAEQDGQARFAMSRFLAFITATVDQINGDTTGALPEGVRTAYDVPVVFAEFFADGARAMTVK